MRQTMQSYADEGEIIAALVDGDSVTLKTYYRDDENKKIVLRAENDFFVFIVTIIGLQRYGISIHQCCDDFSFIGIALHSLAHRRQCLR